jgi:hypothetical protein
LKATLDRVNVPDVKNTDLDQPLFKFALPKDNVYGL